MFNREMDSNNFKESSKSLNACPSIKRMELKDDAHLKKYIMWENKSNICWLDASMSLVAHNKVMKRYSGVSPECRISKIISAYDDAITILNSSDKNINKIINLARGKLKNVQESTLQYLQPILKYKTGDPESAFCSLYNLLIQDAVMKHIFDVTWISIKECTDCGHYSESTKSKPVITLSKIDEFDPENPAVVYNCNCNRSGQKIKLVYASLPPCLIFHFENGAGKGKPPLSFITRGREYQLTGIMTLEKSQDSTVNHFITWVRDPSVDKWLDCNDLNLDITVFSPNFPDINFQDVYMYVYESFDDLGTITDSKIIKTKKSNENIPCIDISEESDNENSNSQSTASEFNEHTGKMETSDSDLKPLKNNTSSTEPDREKSVEASMSADNKVTLHKNIPRANFNQNSKNTCDKTNFKETLQNQREPIEVSDKKVSSEVIITDNNGMLRTSSNVTINVNMTSTDGNDRKEINENISQSDHSEDNINVAKLDGENCCSFPRVKQTLKEKRISSIIEDWSENSKVDCKTSDVESEPSFYNKEQNSSVNTTYLSENIQNKELSSTNICSNTLDKKTGKPENLGSTKIRDLVPTKHNAKKNSKQEEMNDSEQFFTKSDAEQNNERLALNPNVKQRIHRAHFLSDAAVNSSGTSYVKVSVRRKKYPNLPLGKQNYVNNAINQGSDEGSHKMIDGPSFPKSPKRTRETKQEMDEDYDYIPSEMPKKKQRMEKISNRKRNAVITNKKAHYSNAKTKVLKIRLKKSSQAKSKLNHLVNKKRIGDNNSSVNVNKGEKNLESHHKLCSEQVCSQSSAISKDENSDMNSDNGGKILKDFEDMWSCHKSGCNCDSAGLEETIDIVVDYTFAYLSKLSQEFKKSNSH